MKALVYDGVEMLDFRDMPDAAQNDGEHLIRVEAVGICGSDMHAYLGHDARRPAPLILGHEAAGRMAVVSVLLDQRGKACITKPVPVLKNCLNVSVMP